MSESHRKDDCVKVAVMGATGTGKSSFIRLLTNDAEVHIGHDLESETSEIHTAYYKDEKTGRSVMLIDTPGFDDSRGCTDTDILQMLIEFLRPENEEERKLNGIIFLHRMCDIRVGGLARKNIRMFQALCGEKSLRNVRVITTHWDRVPTQEGIEREKKLEQGVFRPILASGAQIHRHYNQIQSAREIMAELIPLEAVSTKLQDQVADGCTLGDTDAGRIINSDTEELMKKHTKELADLKSEKEQAEKDRDEALKAQLDAEQKGLEEKLRRAEEDLARLGMTIDTLRTERNAAQAAVQEVKAWFDKRIAKLQEERAQAQETARKWRGQLERSKTRLLEISKFRQRAQTQGDAPQSRAQPAGKQQDVGSATATVRKWQEDAAQREKQKMEQRAREAELNAAMLQNKIEEIEAEKRKADDYAKRGVFGRFFRGVCSIVGWRSEEENRAS